MNIGIVGAGGVGGLIAALLLSKGHKVYLSARGEHAKVISNWGLTVKYNDKTYREKPTAVLTEDLNKFSECSVILLTVKMYDLESACKSLKSAVNPDTIVVTMQNGVEASEIVSKYFGERNTVGGSIVTSAKIESPGVIVHEGLNLKITIEDKGKRTSEFAEALNGSGASCELSKDIKTSLWKKMINLASASGICCLTRQPIGWVGSHLEAESFLTGLISEAYSVAVACGAELPGTTIEDSCRALVSYNSNLKPSMLLDLERGKRLEVRYLSGAISRLGREKNISTPNSDAVLVALAPFENGSVGLDN